MVEWFEPNDRLIDTDPMRATRPEGGRATFDPTGRLLTEYGFGEHCGKSDADPYSLFAWRDTIKANWQLTAHHGLQPLQSMGQSRRVAAGFRSFGGRLAAIDAVDRHIHRARPPTRCGRQKEGPDHAIGRSRGGLTSKIHVVVDEGGLPIRFALTPGQASDKAAAPGLLEGLHLASVVIADRGYDWQHLINLVGRRGSQAHIPTQRNRKVQRSVVYRNRNLVERFFLQAQTLQTGRHAIRQTRWEFPGCHRIRFRQNLDADL